MNIGDKIKQIRESKGISRDDLALRCKLDQEQIRIIEEEKMEPSLAPLIKIARSLGVRLGTFLDDHENMGPVLSFAGEEKEAVSFSNEKTKSRAHLDFFALASGKTGRHMEPFFITIAPEETKNYQLSTHEGEEFIYVLEGTVEIDYGKEKYQLKKGDSIYFDSIVAHNVHSFGNETAKIVAVVYAPF